MAETDAIGRPHPPVVPTIIVELLRNTPQCRQVCLRNIQLARHEIRDCLIGIDLKIVRYSITIRIGAVLDHKLRLQSGYFCLIFRGIDLRDAWCIALSRICAVQIFIQIRYAIPIEITGTISVKVTKIQHFPIIGHAVAVAISTGRRNGQGCTLGIRQRTIRCGKGDIITP